MDVKKIIVSLLVLISGLFAETWSKTSVLMHYGTTFNYLAGSDRSLDGKMSTLTLEHVGNWEYGSNFFFIDLTSANFSSGKKHAVYAEWAPALSVSKLLDFPLEFGFINDIYLAGEINQGDSFYAQNLGIRLGMTVPGFNFVDCNVFARKDIYNALTYQITLVWNSTFSIGVVPLVFEGFFDVYGVDTGMEIVSQPRVLVDGEWYGAKNLQLGVELYYFQSSKTATRAAVVEYVPQLMLKWIW